LLSRVIAQERPMFSSIVGALERMKEAMAGAWSLAVSERADLSCVRRQLTWPVALPHRICYPK
jgi:hypothetical protein